MLTEKGLHANENLFWSNYFRQTKCCLKEKVKNNFTKYMCAKHDNPINKIFWENIYYAKDLIESY